MAKTVLFLSRRDDRPDFDTAESMAKSLQSHARNLDYESCFLEEVGIVFDGKKLNMINTRNDKDLAEYDGIFLLGWFKLRRHEEIALAVSIYAAENGVKTLNTEALHNRSKGKISQYVRAALADLSAMPFIACVDKGLLPGLVRRSGIGYPAVVKSATGSRGAVNYLVQSEAELRTVLKEAPTKAYVAQPFIPNDGDYRILVAGGKVRLVIHRLASTGTHLNNTSRGGKANIVSIETLPQKMLDDAVAISGLLRREVTGVDMVVHRGSGQPYFLEANNMPQLSTGSFVQEKAQMLNDFFDEWVD